MFSSGSYLHFRECLALDSIEIPFPEGKVRAVFDNQQVIGKTYPVRRNNMDCPLSVITSFTYLSIDNAYLQFDFSLKPEKWFFIGTFLGLRQFVTTESP